MAEKPLGVPPAAKQPYVDLRQAEASLLRGKQDVAGGRDRQTAAERGLRVRASSKAARASSVRPTSINSTALLTVAVSGWSDVSVAARRPYGDTVDVTFEFFRVTVGPCEAERSNKVTAALLRRLSAFLDQLRLNLVHRETEIFIRSGPARRVDAWIAAERIDGKT